MPPDSSELDSDPDTEFAEIDPTGRYGRVRCYFLSAIMKCLV